MIRFDQVDKRYPNGREALWRASRSRSSAGEMVFLTGHSGAGKSSILKLIALIERPTRGQVFVNDQNTAAVKPARHPQLPAQHRRGVPGSQAAARPARLRQRRAAADHRGRAAARDRQARARRARPGRPAGQGEEPAARALDRRAAARRHRARRRRQAAAADRRRADRQPRPGTRARDHAAVQALQRCRRHRGDRDPRPAPDRAIRRARIALAPAAGARPPALPR